MKESVFVDWLHYSLGSGDASAVRYSQDEWKGIYDLAKTHSVLGVTYRRINEIPTGEGPSLLIDAMWEMSLNLIRKSNGLFDRRSAELTRLLADAGFRSCILKGQGTALHYPEPSSRQCGDIDVWVEGSRQQILEFLKGNGYRTCDIVYHHCQARIFDDVKVEVHFTPSFMNSPLLNRRLQKYFRSNSQTQFSGSTAGDGFHVPEIAFATVHSIIHIFRHLFHEGIGLRQIIDLFYLLRALPAEKKADVMATLGSLSLTDFTGALMWVMSKVLGLADEHLLCPASEKKGMKLYDEILKAGNFGINDPDFHRYQSKSVLVRGWSKLSRLAGLAVFCPREVLCAPLFKTVQLLWRKAHRYN